MWENSCVATNIILGSMCFLHGKHSSILSGIKKSLITFVIIVFDALALSATVVITGTYIKPSLV
jgi:hypothetical protein